MNALELQCIDFICTLEKLYFEQRDLAQVCKLFDEEIAWFGTGAFDVCSGLEETQAWLNREKEQFTGSFTIIDSHYDAKAISPGAGLFWGTLRLREKETEKLLCDLSLRVSGVCVKKSGTLKLRQLHLSLPSLDQGEDACFPRIFSEQSTGYLRRLVEKQSHELEERSRDLDALTNNIPGGVICCAAEDGLPILQYSQGFLDMFGYTPVELAFVFHNRFTEMIYAADREAMLSSMNQQLSDGALQELEYRVPCKDGSLVWVLDRGQLVTDENGKDFFYCILMDITNSKLAQEELRLTLERHQIIMNQTTDIIFEWDITQDSLHFSGNWEKKFGYPPATKSICVTIPSNRRIHPDDLRVFFQIMDDMLHGIGYSEGELRVGKADGDFLWCRIRATLQMDENKNPVKAVGVIIDIDAEKRQAEKLLAQAQRDTLTGLYNKGTAQNLIEKRLHRQKPGRVCALFILDVDDFKNINDAYGHLSGDVLLTNVARVLKKQFRTSDVVGRIGGDEFCMFAENIQTGANAEKKAQAVLESVRALLKESVGTDLFSCSIGISLTPQDGTDFTTLYKNADTALYHAKTQGKNRFSFYTPDLSVSFFTPCATDAPSSPEAFSCPPNRSIGECVFHTLYRAKQLEYAIPSSLDFLGRQFSASRIYVYELSMKEPLLNNTFLWHACESPAKTNRLKKLPQSLVSELCPLFKKNGYIYSKDGSHIPEFPPFLNAQASAPTLLCAVQDSSHFHGLIGFENTKTQSIWSQEQIHNLSFAAEILGTFLMKWRLEKQIC